MLTNERLTQLGEKPLFGKFDLKHLKNIHKYIFQDVYPFAGKLRDVDIAKNNTLFCKTLFVPNEASRIFNELKQESTLKIMT